MLKRNVLLVQSATLSCAGRAVQMLPFATNPRSASPRLLACVSPEQSALLG